jgi:hypothetical protein
MGRAERRRAAKLEREFDRMNEYQQKAAIGNVIDSQIAKVAAEVEEYTKHHITGEIYTALAVVLRSAPYYWSADKTMRLMGKVSGIINDLNLKRITDNDLIAAGEQKGIRVMWDAKHEYIDQLGIFEE